MNRVSQILTQDVFVDMFKWYRALTDHDEVFHSIFHHRARERRSLKQKFESQQYLILWKKKVFIKFLLQMSDFEQSVRIKFISLLAFNVIHQRSSTNRSFKFSNRNWAKTIEKRHSILQTRRIKSLYWNRHEKNIYNKIIHWFEMIEMILQDSIILLKNVYNMNETEIMLFMSNSVKVLINKNDIRDYRDAWIKRTTMTAIECISADDRYLTSMIIWSIITHRSNWITFRIFEWQYACFESEYIDFKISLKWLKQIFNLQTKEQAN